MHLKKYHVAFPMHTWEFDKLTIFDLQDVYLLTAADNLACLLARFLLMLSLAIVLSLEDKKLHW